MTENTEVMSPNALCIRATMLDVLIHDANFVFAFFSMIKTGYSGYAAHDGLVAVGNVSGK